MARMTKFCQKCTDLVIWFTCVDISGQKKPAELVVVLPIFLRRVDNLRERDNGNADEV